MERIETRACYLVDFDRKAEKLWHWINQPLFVPAGAALMVLRYEMGDPRFEMMFGGE